MTRPYPHGPDAEFAEQTYARAARRVELARTAVSRTGSADVGSLQAALDGLWEALAWGWLTERPVEELRALLPPAVELVGEGLRELDDGPPDVFDVERWVCTALLAGDDEVAARAGAMQVQPLDQDGGWLPVTLLALARGDEAAAADGARRMREILAAPTTGPGVVTGFAHLGDLAEAVLRRDQGGFEQTLVARGEAMARYHSTTQLRRRWTGVLDRTAIGLALTGTRRGLVLPEGVPTVPAELLTALNPAIARDTKAGDI